MPSVALAMSREEAYKVTSDAISKVMMIASLSESQMTADHVNEIEKALSYVADINANALCKLGEFTPLMVAAYYGNSTICRLLVGHKADVNKKTSVCHGNPLDYAMSSDFDCNLVIDFLLEYNTDWAALKAIKEGDIWGSERLKDPTMQAIIKKHIFNKVYVVLTKDPANIVAEYATLWPEQSEKTSLERFLGLSPE